MDIIVQRTIQKAVQADYGNLGTTMVRPGIFSWARKGYSHIDPAEFDAGIKANIAGEYRRALVPLTIEAKAVIDPPPLQPALDEKLPTRSDGIIPAPVFELVVG